jgi:hypothetical protein
MGEAIAEGPPIRMSVSRLRMAQLRKTFLIRETLAIEASKISAGSKNSTSIVISKTQFRNFDN